MTPPTRSIVAPAIAFLVLTLLAIGVLAPRPGQAEPERSPASARADDRATTAQPPLYATLPTNAPAAPNRVPKLADIGVKQELALPAFAPIAGSLDPRIRLAYEWAASDAERLWPECSMRWTILAAVGSVESAHGAHHGTAIILNDSGQVLPPILGPPLDGVDGRTYIKDSDGGALDGEAAYDRAVGPMQFLPSTWKRNGMDANGDGVADPHSMDDAALSAAKYLCITGRGSMEDVAALERALFSYNRDTAYVALVRSRIDRFDVEFGLVAPAEIPQLPVFPVPDPAPAPAPGTTTPAPPATAPPAPTTTTTPPTTTPPTATTPPPTTAPPPTTTDPPSSTTGP